MLFAKLCQAFSTSPCACTCQHPCARGNALVHQRPRVIASLTASCWRENASCVKGKSSLSTDNTHGKACGCRTAGRLHPGRCGTFAEGPGGSEASLNEFVPQFLQVLNFRSCLLQDSRWEGEESTSVPAWPGSCRVPAGSHDVAAPWCISVKKENNFQSGCWLWFHLPPEGGRGFTATGKLFSSFQGILCSQPWVISALDSPPLALLLA